GFRVPETLFPHSVVMDFGEILKRRDEVGGGVLEFVAALQLVEIVQGGKGAFGSIGKRGSETMPFGDWRPSAIGLRIVAKGKIFLKLAGALIAREIGKKMRHFLNCQETETVNGAIHGKPLRVVQFDFGHNGFVYMLER